MGYSTRHIMVIIVDRHLFRNSLNSRLHSTSRSKLLKGSRTCHSVKVSFWYASVLTITRFRLLNFRISNCQAHLMLH